MDLLYYIFAVHNIINMFKYSNLILLFGLVIISVGAQKQRDIKEVKNYYQLAHHHCDKFPIELIWRAATGHLSQNYGEQFFDYDCYIRQFIRRDGLGIEEEGDEESQQENQQEQQNDKGEEQTDIVVAQYADGLKKCLPSTVNPQQAVYAMWRFFRFLVHHDYLYEWMRAKIRSSLGYQAERPNTWMDGQNSAPRLRLDKLFSNQFYEYVDKLMFKDFLYPLMTFLKSNTILIAPGKTTKSGKPILIQSVETHNYMPTVFEPVKFWKVFAKDHFFTYTIPGLPILFAGSYGDFAWSFSGVLVDRTNIQEIQTVGNKFYHHDTEQWLKLDSEQIKIPGVENKTCKFMHSAYGPLYTKHNSQGKMQEYIVRWHEKQAKLRNFFTDMNNFVMNHGNIESDQHLQFPFNSLMMINQTGAYQYICQQFYPSYFIYPDMFGEPQQIKQRWIAYPDSKKLIVVSNSHLTPTNQQAYFKGQPLTPLDEQFAIAYRNLKQDKFTKESLLQFFRGVSTTPLVKKQKQLMMKMYRRIKFYYLPQDRWRKQCDQLINLLEKWDNSLNDKKIAPIYIMWDYFLKEYTFNYLSHSQFGLAIIKHDLITDNYWYNQMVLWDKGTSYGECDSNQYEEMKHLVNGTGHNSSCYLNIMRAINKTREVLVDRYGPDFSKINLDDFTAKKYFTNKQANFKGTHVQQAFKVYYSNNVMFAAEVDSFKVLYTDSYEENIKKAFIFNYYPDTNSQQYQQFTQYLKTFQSQAQTDSKQEVKKNSQLIDQEL